MLIRDGSARIHVLNLHKGGGTESNNEKKTEKREVYEQSEREAVLTNHNKLLTLQTDIIANEELQELKVHTLFLILGKNSVTTSKTELMMDALSSL